MSDIAIKVENLHKLYRLGLKDDKENDTLVQTALSWIKAPQKNLANLRKLTSFDLNTEDPDILHALNDVSFEVKHGEVLGVIGRNGAGKSTLLKVLSRITEPTSGRVTINGRVASLLEVGTGFHPELTGRENIYMNGTILGMSRKEIDRKFDEIVDFSGVERFLDTPVKRYSSGMKVRLAFSVAAHLEPEILIVDEVLAVGDADFQKKCLGKMQDVSSSGKTVLFVSHQLGSVVDLCGKCLLMKNGQVQAMGLPQEIVSQYLSAGAFSVGHVDLLKWDDRTGNGPMKISHCTLTDAFEDVCCSFEYGETVNVKVVVDNVKKSGFKVGISLRDELGNLVIHYTSEDSQKGNFSGHGSNNVMCSFTNNLNTGSYYLTIWLGDDYGLHDRVANCLKLESSLSSLGKINCQSKIYLPADWEFKFSQETNNEL